MPNERERRIARDYLLKSDDRTTGAEDIMWALITSREFVFNH